MFIKINDLRIYCKVLGEGDSIVLIHGWGSKAEYFSRVQEHLAQHFKTIAIDLPGCGLSSPLPAIWKTPDYAKCVMEVVQQLNLGPIILMGHSLGGKISLYLTANHLLPVKKLILIGSAGIRFPKPWYFRAYIRFLNGLVRIPGFKIVFGRLINWYKKRFGSADYRQASGLARESLVQIIQEDFRGLLASVDVPTLLIWGENDAETPIKAADAMKQLMPQAQLNILPRCGHFPFLDDSQNFIACVDDFLK